MKWKKITIIKKLKKKKKACGTLLPSKSMRMHKRFPEEVFVSVLESINLKSSHLLSQATGPHKPTEIYPDHKAALQAGQDKCHPQPPPGKTTFYTEASRALPNINKN